MSISTLATPRATVSYERLRALAAPAAILLGALLLRALLLIHFQGTIDTEGAEYARIAQNILAGRGYVGIATPGTELMFPPLFPLLIAGVTLLVGDAELAARLISVVMGALLVVPMQLLSARLYGRRAGQLAAILVAIHPLLVRLSTTAYCESTYMTLVLTAAYLALRCRDRGQRHVFAAAGLVLGLAYLTRPEAFLYPFLLTGVVLLPIGGAARGRLRALAPRWCIALLVFAVLSAPYIAWLSHMTGGLRFEGKGAVNYAIGSAVLDGRDENAAPFGVGPDLRESGVWMRSNLSVIETTHYQAGPLIRYAVSRFRSNLPAMLETIASATAFGSPFLFMLAVLGLFRRPWTREHLADQLALLTVVGVIVLSLGSIFRMEERFIYLLLPVMVIWASNGIVALSCWALDTVGLLRGRTPRGRFLVPAVEVAAIGLVLLAAMMGLGGVGGLERFGAKNQPQRTAATWLDQYHPGPKQVMDSWAVIAFHAGASYRHFPYADAATAIAYIDRQKVDFIVLSDAAMPHWPYLRDWLDNGIPDRRAKLVYSAGAAPQERIAIYQWSAPEGASTMPRTVGQPAWAEVRAAFADAGPIPTAGPLRRGTGNGRYFVDRQGHGVYLTGAHTWAAFQDAARLPGDPAFDFGRYLKFLADHHLNFLRLFTWEQADWVPWRPYHYRLRPTVFARTGPGTALDGEPRFDLTSFDQAYFDRLRERVTMAGARGIYVSVMLFDGFSVERKGLDGANPWLGHPYNAANNVNGIDGDPARRGNGTLIHSLQDERILGIEETYLRKVADTLAGLDNVLFEICNECTAGSVPWQYHMIRYLKAYEAGLAMQHPVGMTVPWPGGSNAALLASPADWIAPNQAGGYDNDPPAADGSKVILSDTDHIWGLGGDRRWVWKSFLRGLNPIFMDPYDNGWAFPPDIPGHAARWESVRTNLGYTALLARRLGLETMAPRPDLASSGYCLARVSGEQAALVAYAPEDGPLTVDLAGIPGRFSVSWLDPGSGRVVAAAPVTGGQRHRFDPPFPDDAVLVLRAAGSDPAN
jgi:4-amino-4-deoxy-L-arabinose transferase-like glycosyltransferase